MREPKVSILWLNYNSSSFMDIVLESLQGVNDLNYSNYELIVVDNGSTDTSYKTIRDFVSRMHIKNKVIRLPKNLGFTGGNNIAYKARDKDSEYIVLLNNDAVPYQNSLKEMIEVMREYNTLGAAQGIILQWDCRKIDTAGDYLDEIFGSHPLFSGGENKNLKRPIYITYADGAYSIYKVNAVKQNVKSDKLFYDFMFGYYEDAFLGLKLWNNGYKIASFPFVVAKHKRSSSFGRVRPIQVYFSVKNQIILNEISNSRFKNYIKVLWYRAISSWNLSKKLSKIVFKDKRRYPSEMPILLLKAIKNGEKIGKWLRENGEKINIYSAPILKMKISETFLGLITRRIIGREAEKMLNKLNLM